MLRSRWALWAGILVFPPLGLVLWWMRRGVGPVARIAGTLGICAVAIVELFVVYGMRLEWNGALKVSGVSFETRAQRDARLEALLGLFGVYGWRLEWNGALKVSGVSFEPRAQRDARLEASRARQRAEAPAPAPAPSAAPVETARAVAPPAPARTTEHVPPAYWTDFRGPNRAGVYAETEIETAWPAAGLPRLWKQPVGEGRAYTIEQRRDREAITAYDVKTGRELWAFAYPALFGEILGGAGPRAT